MAKSADKSGIYVDAQNLFRLLYTAQFEMDKRDRPVIVTRMFDHTGYDHILFRAGIQGGSD